MATKGFWYRLCPLCEQGQLFVTMREDDGELMLECDECYSGWKMPEHIRDSQKAFFADQVKTHMADREEIL